MKASRAMGKFIGWAAGIAGTVIGAVLIYHFTTPPPPITFQGMVINGDLNAPVQGAMVSFEISDTRGGPYHDFTDEHGSYRLDFAGLKTSSRAVLRAQANGYKPSTPVSLASIANDNRTDFVLHPAPQPGASPTPTPQPGPIRFKYIPKLPVQAIRVQQLSH